MANNSYNLLKIANNILFVRSKLPLMHELSGLNEPLNKNNTNLIDVPKELKYVNTPSRQCYEAPFVKRFSNTVPEEFEGRITNKVKAMDLKAKVKKQETDTDLKLAAENCKKHKSIRSHFRVTLINSVLQSSSNSSNIKIYEACRCNPYPILNADSMKTIITKQRRLWFSKSQRCGPKIKRYRAKQKFTKPRPKSCTPEVLMEEIITARPQVKPRCCIKKQDQKPRSRCK